MSIHQYLQLIRRHIALLVLFPLLCAAGGYIGAKSQPKVYRATAHVLLRPNDPNERVGTGGSNGMELLSADRIVQAQADIARGPGVLRQAAASLTNTTERDLEKVVTVTTCCSSRSVVLVSDAAACRRTAGPRAMSAWACTMRSALSNSIPLLPPVPTRSFGSFGRSSTWAVAR